jgi:hypothetical protein
MIGYKRNSLYIKAKEIFEQDCRDVKLDDQLEQWKDVMNHYGFEHLGSGSNGSAYMYPGYSWVFKIFRGDDAYLCFIRYVLSNQDNPNLPKIKGGIIQITSDTYLVRLEKLHPLLPGEYDKISVVIDDMAYSLIDRRSYHELSNHQKRSINKFPWIYKFLKYWCDNIVYDLDLRESNIMVRGDTPVLLDPVSL